jgi:CheY-like chemotaxis protein
VHSVETGPRAVEVARSVRLDFSILDMHLPGMTGLEVFRTIAAEVGSVPAILMSGQASREDTDTADALGFYTFLRKPLELGAFRLSLERLVRHYFGPPHFPALQ